MGRDRRVTDLAITLQTWEREYDDSRPLSGIYHYLAEKLIARENAAVRDASHDLRVRETVQ